MNIQILALLAFMLIYNCLMFKLCSKLYLVKNSIKKTYLLTSIINCSFLYLSLQYKFNIGIMQILCLIILFFEMKFIYKESAIKNFFAAISFCVNIFSVYYIVISIHALYTSYSINYIINNELMLLSCISITLIISSICLFLIQFIFDIRSLNLIKTSKSNLIFLNIINTCLFVYMSIVIQIYCLNHNYPNIELLLLKVGIFTIIGYIISLMFAIVYSKIQLFENLSNEIEMKIDIKKETELKLKDMAYIDSMTGFYKRSYAMEYLENLIINNQTSFSIGYIDIDGLKQVNDMFGHNEGDSYILSVSNIIHNVFKNEIIARIGGDEFLIIMSGKDQFDAEKMLKNSFDAIAIYSLSYIKNYTMSISYGVYEVKCPTSLNIDQIINLADNKMYEFKKLQKKNDKSFYNSNH